MSSAVDVLNDGVRKQTINYVSTNWFTDLKRPISTQKQGFSIEFSVKLWKTNDVLNFFLDCIEINAPREVFSFLYNVCEDEVSRRSVLRNIIQPTTSPKVISYWLHTFYTTNKKLK